MARIWETVWPPGLSGICVCTGNPYNQAMQTVIEHPTFQRQAASIWTESELHAFIDWIAANPLAGDVIPGAEGARKVRWAGQGKARASAVARE